MSKADSHRILRQGMITKLDRRTGKPKECSGVYTSGMIAVLANGQRCIVRLIDIRTLFSGILRFLQLKERPNTLYVLL